MLPGWAGSTAKVLREERTDVPRVTVGCNELVASGASADVLGGSMVTLSDFLLLQKREAEWH